MKYTINFSRVILVVILGFTLATCQKEEEMVLNSLNETGTESPRLKAVVYNEYIWYHLDYLTYNAIIRMLYEGTLSKGNANALIVKYKAARENLWRGKYDTATGVLNAFIDLVNDLVAEGKILDVQGAELVMVPAAIIESFSFNCGDLLYDVRDGQSYETVKIGDQCWMAENLNFQFVSYEGMPLSFYYNNDPEYGAIYGSLYVAANDVLIVACPIGWHLPSDEEWKTLEKYLGMSEEDADSEGRRYSGNVGFKLKSASGWVKNGNGDNSSGFNALPSGLGLWRSSNYDGINMICYFWSSTRVHNDLWSRALNFEENDVYREKSSERREFAIRCVKND